MFNSNIKLLIVLLLAVVLICMINSKSEIPNQGEIETMDQTDADEPVTIDEIEDAVETEVEAVDNNITSELEETADVVEDDKTWRERLQNSVLNIPLPVSAILSEPKVKVSQMVNFKKGDLLQLGPVEGVDLTQDSRSRAPEGTNIRKTGDIITLNYEEIEYESRAGNKVKMYRMFKNL